MPTPESYSWVNLAGGTPGYVTNRPETVLSAEETPSATGLDITVPGYIKTGTIPTGTARVAKSYAIGTDTYYLHYRRLWRTNGTQIIYGAPDYTAVYLPQGRGWIDKNETTNAFKTFLPIGDNGLIFFKTDGAYIMPNASAMSANFEMSDLIQEAHIATATYACELDGIVYFANSDGLFSIDAGGKVTELSEPIRGNITAAAITADYEQKYIIVGNAMVYSVNDKKFLKYSGSTFLFESRKLHNKDNTILAVSMIDFEYDKTSTAQGNIIFQVQASERGYGAQTYTLPVRNVRGEEEHVHMTVPPENGLSWQLKITALPSNLKIKNIWVRAKGYTQESMDS